MVSKKSKLLYEEEDIVLLAKGEQSKTARAVRRRLKEIGYSCSLLEVGSKASVDQEMIRFLSEEHRLFVTMEAEAEGSLGAQIQDVVSGQGLPGRVLVIAVPDAYAKDSLQTLPSEEADMDIESVTEQIIATYIVTRPHRPVACGPERENMILKCKKG